MTRSLASLYGERIAQIAHQSRSGEVRQSLDNENRSAATTHRLALDAVFAILGAIHVNVWFHFVQKRDGIRLVKNVDVVDHAQRKEHLGPSPFRNDRTTRAFVVPD